MVQVGIIHVHAEQKQTKQKQGVRRKENKRMEQLKMEISATITDKAVEFQNKVIGISLEKWGYSKADVEKAMKELSEYKGTGLSPDEIMKLKEREEEKDMIVKEIYGTILYQCPVCEEIVYCADTFCPNCGQRINEGD